jgi:FkbM family methyltransferase
MDARLAIRKLLHKFGYDIVKLKPLYRKGALDKEVFLKENAWLQQWPFKTILDIGANEGQFSEKMRLLFPRASIYAFEPLKDVYQTLISHFENDPHFKAFNIGLGSERNTFEINRNESSASSSLLDMTDVHTSHFEHAVGVTKEVIEVDSLEHIFEGQRLASPMLIKMDVQGYEKAVIAGGKSILAQADMVISEVSFEALYKGQPLFDEIYAMMKDMGFGFAGCFEQLHSPASNKILQADAIFIKGN